MEIKYRTEKSAGCFSTRRLSVRCHVLKCPSARLWTLRLIINWIKSGGKKRTAESMNQQQNQRTSYCFIKNGCEENIILIGNMADILMSFLFSMASGFSSRTQTFISNPYGEYGEWTAFDGIITGSFCPGHFQSAGLQNIRFQFWAEFICFMYLQTTFSAKRQFEAEVSGFTGRRHSANRFACDYKGSEILSALDVTLFGTKLSKSNT